MKQLAANGPPLVADALGVFFLLAVTPPIRRQFQEQTFMNAIIVAAFFAVFCLAIVLIRRLHGETRSYDLARFRWWLAGLSLPLVLFVLWTIGDTIGFLDSVVVASNQRLDELGASLYLLLTPASWLMVGLIYPACLAGDIAQTVRPGTRRYLLYALLGLSGINLLFAILLAFWGILWARWQPAGEPAGWLLLLLPVLLLLFVPPRLLYAARSPRLAPQLSFLALIIFCAWQIVQGRV